MVTIRKNRIRCRKCGDVIESCHRHDRKYCSCRSVAVDGGKEKLIRMGESADYIDLTLFNVEEDD